MFTCAGMSTMSLMQVQVLKSFSRFRAWNLLEQTRGFSVTMVFSQQQAEKVDANTGNVCVVIIDYETLYIQ